MADSPLMAAWPLPPTGSAGHSRLRSFGLLAWCLFGLWGHIRYVDDTTVLRLTSLTYIGLPLLILTVSLYLLSPAVLEMRPRVRRSLTMTLMLIYVPGHLLILNTIGQRSGLIKRTVSIQGRVAVRDVERGTLGILYTRRW